MTEMMEYLEIEKSPEPLPGRYALDPVAFAGALIGAPVLVALLGFWAAGIPVFAVLFGGPFYLVFGTPVLLTYLLWHHGTPQGAAGLGLATVLAVAAAAWAIGTLFGLRDITEVVGFLGGFGLVFGPLWGLAFGALYNRWRNAMSRHPLPPLV